MNILLYLISSICSAILAIQIARDSYLFYTIKSSLHLTEENLHTTKWLCTLQEFVNCPYCISFHISWIASMILLNVTLPVAVILAPLSILLVDVVMYLTRWLNSN